MRPMQHSRFYFEEITIDNLHQGYLTGEFTVSEVVQAYLGRIEAVDHDPNGPALHSVITLNSEALDIAASMDAQLMQAKEGKLPPFWCSRIIKR